MKKLITISSLFLFSITTFADIQNCPDKLEYKDLSARVFCEVQISKITHEEVCFYSNEKKDIYRYLYNIKTVDGDFVGGSLGESELIELPYEYFTIVDNEKLLSIKEDHPEGAVNLSTTFSVNLETLIAERRVDRKHGYDVLFYKCHEL